MSDRPFNLDTIWSRLRAHAGDEFETKTGKPFTYEIDGHVFRPSRTARNIHATNFEKVIGLLPIDGPGEISNVVQGSAYVWAVLHDRRIRKNDW